MTPEEIDRSVAVLKRAIEISNRHGQNVLTDCDNSAAVAATAAAIMLSTFCSAAGISMHEAVSLFMSVHKQTEAMVKERS